MREPVISVVNKYIDAIRRNDAAAVPLHPEMIGEFPTNTYRGAVAFREALEPFSRAVNRIEVLRLIVEDEHCVALLELDTIYGLIPFAEHIHVVNDEIVFVRGYCDPRPMLKRNEPAT